MQSCSKVLVGNSRIEDKPLSIVLLCHKEDTDRSLGSSPEFDNISGEKIFDETPVKMLVVQKAGVDMRCVNPAILNI